MGVVLSFFPKKVKKMWFMGIEPRQRGAAAWSAFEALHEKPGITHRIVTIGFGISGLLALDFNENKYMCVFF